MDDAAAEHVEAAAAADYTAAADGTAAVGFVELEV